MRTLLVIAKQSGLGAALASVLDSNEYRLILHEEVWEAESILMQGAIDLCVLDAELTDVQPVRMIKQIRRVSANCPIIIYTSTKQWEWEEEAYILGVQHILAKPVRGALLHSLLQRLWSHEAPAAESPARPPIRESSGMEGGSRPEGALKVLRDFSTILTHSLCSDSLLKQFLLLLREVLGVNRAAIFLRQPVRPKGGLVGDREDLVLRPVCALGIAPGLLDHLVLSPQRGIGHYIYRSGRILKNGSDEARADLVAQKEFALLGAQVAIPILDRESVVGVAVFDGRLTGEFFANEELALIFHLLEGVGLAIKNSWLYDQLSEGHEMLTDVLNELEGGCIVVNRQLEVVHANPAARKFFLTEAERKRLLEFRDLPQPIASKVFQVLQTASVQPPFMYRPSPEEMVVYQIRIRAFKTQNSVTTNSALLLVEDVTDRERLHQLELEAANLALIKSIASQLAHEIGNAVVPVMTRIKLSAKPSDDPLEAALQQAADAGCARIVRLVKQVRYLASDDLGLPKMVTVREIADAAATDASAQLPGKVIVLQNEEKDKNETVQGDPQQLRHALGEVFLNALQASPANKPVRVNWQVDSSHPKSCICIEVQDSGEGFPKEALERATDPFYSTRTVGLGLGLAVAKRIIEMHKGRIQLESGQGSQNNTVRIFLPREAAPA
jgi:signal transduction histidine kinase/CheY-like chemotaxis protein